MVQIIECRNDLKKTGKIMKDIIGINTKYETYLPLKVIINKEEITDKKKVAAEHNIFFTNIGLKLASEIPTSSKPFENFIKQVDVTMTTLCLSIIELKDVFFSLKKQIRALVMKK